MRAYPHQRFFEKVAFQGGDGCWLWNAGKDRFGYGRFREGGAGSRTVRAHRWCYELLVGDIPDDLQMDHLCKNPSCVKPSHLEPVTARENILRSNGVAALNARKSHCSKGHPFDDGNTYLHGGKRSCRKCAVQNEIAYQIRKGIRR